MKIFKQQTQRYTYVFQFEFSYVVLDFCRALKVKHGVKKFSFFDGQWRFSDVAITDEIKERYPSITIADEVKEDLNIDAIRQYEQSLKDKEAERIKKATESLLHIPELNRPLYPFQLLGVEFLINASGRALLADQMGTGKTAQALGYIAYTRKKKTLVLAPASTKYGWADETKKWTKLKPLVIDSRTNLSFKKVNDHDIFIINYDLLQRFHEELSVIGFDCMVIDECHYIKSPSAIRSKLTRSLSSKIASVILLSGTPLLNRPVEMFNALQIIDPKTWNDYYSYTARYCDGQRGVWGWEAKGATNTLELNERIQRYFLRRLKKDVLKELPPKTYINVPVELEPKTKKEYLLAEKNFVRYLKEVKKKSVSYNNGLVEAIVKLGELRQLSSRGKVESAKELIESIIESGQKVCVFSVYNAPLEALSEHFGKESVLLTGKTAVKERPNIIKKFQQNKDVKVFLGGLVAAGAGITLTSAENVVFLDYSYVPADHKQAEDRIHRPGQTASSVSIYQLYAKGTIDERMQDILDYKQAVVDRVLEGQTAPTKDDVIKKLLEQYEE